MTLICERCAKEKAIWTEDCPHAVSLWRDGYHHGLQDCSHPRLTSDDVLRALNGLTFSWTNFYHLVADALNRILDEKEKGKVKS